MAAGSGGVTLVGEASLRAAFGGSAFGLSSSGCLALRVPRVTVGSATLSVGSEPPPRSLVMVSVTGSSVLGASRVTGSGMLCTGSSLVGTVTVTGTFVSPAPTLSVTATGAGLVTVDASGEMVEVGGSMVEVDGSKVEVTGAVGEMVMVLGSALAGEVTVIVLGSGNGTT